MKKKLATWGEAVSILKNFFEYSSSCVKNMVQAIRGVALVLSQGKDCSRHV